MHSPIPHDLKKYDEKFDFEKNGFCPEQWEVCVPQRSCIIWSVVLSYLRSAVFTVPGQFEERLNRLAKSVLDPESVKSAILDFNPFYNFHKCFFNEDLKKINSSFKKLLDENRPSTEKKTVPQDLQIISTLLKINILIVDLIDEKLHLITPSNGDNVAAIALFCRKNITDEKTQFVTKRFTFSLSKDLCWELRQSAFETILKQMRSGADSTVIRDIFEREIQKIPDKKEKRINILSALLKNDATREISELYDSSYTIAKLADAGFETDPRVLDVNGLSAFYYALFSSDKYLVYLLHKHAVNNGYKSDKTFRDPDSCVLANLMHLQKIIRDDRFKSQNFQRCDVEAEKARLGSEELQAYNEFLIKTCEGIQNVKKHPMQEATMLKKIILHVLEVYDEFFSLEQLDANVTESELLENYTKHKVYYDNLDSTASLIFFDNIFLLKRLLFSSQSRSYWEMESEFVLSIMTNKYFSADIQNVIQKYNKSVLSKKSESFGFQSESFYIFCLVERLRLRQSVRNFCRILKEDELTEKDVVKCISKQDISKHSVDIKDESTSKSHQNVECVSKQGTLRHFPEIKDESISKSHQNIEYISKQDILRDFPEINDEFLLARLHYYLSSALESNPEDLKQKFVIQRALQVIGESVKIEAGNPSSIQHLLRSSLPSETVATLNQLRNRLSHIKNFQFPITFKIERDDALFREIQFEIQCIKEAFKDVFDIQKVRFLEFLINRGLESVQKYRQPVDVAVFGNDPMLARPLENFAEAMRKRSSEFLVYRLDHYLGIALETVSRGLKQNFVIDRALKLIDEFMYVDKKYPLSIRQVLHEDLHENTLKVLEKARGTFSRLQFPLKFEIEQDDSSFKTIHSEIKNIKHSFGKTFDIQRVQVMEFLINQSLRRLGGREDMKTLRKTSPKVEGHKVIDEKLPSINEFCRRLMGFVSIREEEKIREEIPVQVKARVDAIKKLEVDLKRGIPVDLERFDCLFLKMEDIFNIEKDYEKYLEEEADASKSSMKSSLLRKIQKAPNPLNILDSIFEKNKVSNSQLDVLYEAVEFSTEAKATLNSLIEISKDSFGDNLENLLNRIQHLQRIAIDEQYDIRYLWERAKSIQAKQHLAYKIVQRFLHEPCFRASIEMLLFHCFAILKNNEDFKSFWLKSSYLFNGIDVRNVLVHGDPLLESIGDMLDPKDFPSELVKKVLQLIEDRKCVEALCDLRRKAARDVKILENCPECLKLKESIVCCERWQEYSKLLAEDRKGAEISDSIGSFLKKSSKPKGKKGKN